MDEKCLRCHCDRETEAHVLFECPQSNEVLESLGRDIKWARKNIVRCKDLIWHVLMDNQGVEERLLEEV